MTVSQFRKLALSLPQAQESEHMSHPDFRVGGKIFATLGWPDTKFGTVMFTPVQQAAYVQAHPRIFQAIDNGWGRKGATHVSLKQATIPLLMPALCDAWRNTAPKRLVSLLDADD